VKKKPLVKKKSAGAGSPRADTTGSSPTKDEVIKSLKDKSKDAKILIKKSKKLESQLSVLPTVTDEKYGLGNIALEIASEDKSKMNTLLETSYKEKNLDFLDKSSNNQKNESSDTNQSKLKQNTSLEKTLKEIKEEIIAENKPKEPENKPQKEEEKLTDSNVSKRDEEGVKKNMNKSLVKSILKKDNSKKDLSISITAFSKKSEEDSSMELMKPTNNMKKGKSFSSKSSKKSLLVKEDKEDLEDGDDSPPHLGTLTRGKTEGHLTKYLKPKSKVSKFAKEKGKNLRISI